MELFYESPLDTLLESLDDSMDTVKSIHRFEMLSIQKESGELIGDEILTEAFDNIISSIRKALNKITEKIMKFIDWVTDFFVKNAVKYKAFVKKNKELLDDIDDKLVIILDDDMIIYTYNGPEHPLLVFPGLLDTLYSTIMEIGEDLFKQDLDKTGIEYYIDLISSKNSRRDILEAMCNDNFGSKKITDDEISAASESLSLCKDVLTKSYRGDAYKVIADLPLTSIRDIVDEYCEYITEKYSYEVKTLKIMKSKIQKISKEVNKSLDKMRRDNRGMSDIDARTALLNKLVNNVSDTYSNYLQIVSLYKELTEERASMYVKFLQLVLNGQSSEKYETNPKYLFTRYPYTSLRDAVNKKDVKSAFASLSSIMRHVEKEKLDPDPYLVYFVKYAEEKIPNMYELHKDDEYNEMSNNTNDWDDPNYFPGIMMSYVLNHSKERTYHIIDVLKYKYNKKDDR